MRHIVTGKFNCAKCGISDSGAAGQLLDYIACTKCADIFNKKVVPKFEKLTHEFFQPERLNEMAPKGDAKV